MLPATEGPMVTDDAPEKTIPARRVRPAERESEKRQHDKIASHRKAAKTKIKQQEAEADIRQALRLGSGSEYLEASEDS